MTAYEQFLARKQRQHAPAGIGSEGYVSILHKRRFVGIELKPSYWSTAVDNLRKAEERAATPSLFDAPADDVVDVAL